jgi:alkane 1-monooxygenase
MEVTTDRVIDVDSKKRWWLVSGLAPILGLITVGVYGLTGWWPLLAYVPLHIFVVLPLGDRIVNLDRTNISPEAADELAETRYYMLLCQIYVVLQIYAFLAALWWIVTQESGWVEQALLTVNVGLLGGVALSPAHELGHKQHNVQRWFGRVSMAQSFQGHFFIQHNRGHHRHVATPEDHGTARYGESFWAFLPRTVVGGIRLSWKLEADRLRAAGRSPFALDNEAIRVWGITVILWAYAIAYAGWDILPFLLGQAAIGILLVEAVMYLSHYGLLRLKLPNGRYEKPQPHHSWDSLFALSNLSLFNLQRHSDHHAHPTRPYHLLRNDDAAPKLPAGLATMALVATVPPLWFRVMNPRVEAVCDGDLTRANLTDALRAELGPPPVLETDR